MAKAPVKYKVMFLNKDDSQKKDLKVLMEEATVGHILECNSSKQITAELEALKAQGWAVKVKAEVVGWGHILYMESIK